MIIKKTNTSKTSLSYFDLLGKDETALSKAFAYLLATDKDCYFEFLKFLQIPCSRTKAGFSTCEIAIERHRNEGRTDIELVNKNYYHVIIECKVRKGKILNQRTQYLTSFNPEAKVKLLCFLTQERDTNKQLHDDIQIINTSWLEIIELFNKKKFYDKEIVTAFLKFATKNYKMRELKEVLIQDISFNTELERYRDYGVYRRDQTFGTPIYFAPYFTKKLAGREGISCLSKILGILTLKPSEIEAFRSDLEAFSKSEEQVNNWIHGVQHGNDDENRIYTYYFMAPPFVFPNPLVKDKGNHKGVGKGWVSKKIPQNRCVSFTNLLQHVPELMDTRL